MQEDIFELNRDDKLRQKIMGIKADYEYSETHDFDKMTRETFKKLLENGFIDLDECYNNSPPIGEYKELLERYKGEKIYLHGYIVSPERSDYGLIVEGIEAFSTDKEFIIEFSNLFHDADEFECKDGYQRCWYD